MEDWQLAATTIYCDAVDDDVTILVYKDSRTRCTGYSRYVENLDRERARVLRKKGKRLGRNLKCEGPDDYRITACRDKLVAERQ